MPKYESTLTYEVTLGEPEYTSEAMISEASLAEVSFTEAHSDIVYAATAAYDVGDVQGFVFWGTDEEDKWIATTDPDMDGRDIEVLYGRVTYKVEFIKWDYEGAE